MYVQEEGRLRENCKDWSIECKRKHLELAEMEDEVNNGGNRLFSLQLLGAST